MISKNIKPFINIGPGDILKEDLEALNWTKADLAEKLGMTEKSVNQIIHNKQVITIDIARLLGKVFNLSTEFWMNLDANYRKRLMKVKEK